MSTTMGRRDFIKGGSVCAAAAAVAGLTGCSSQSAGTTETKNSTSTDKNLTVETTMDTDIVVIGLGASGMMAAIAAADAGSDVIAIDAAAGFAASTNCSTTGVFFVEGTREKQNAGYVTKQEAYDYLMEGTHYTENPSLMRNMLEVSGKAADVLDSTGMPLLYMFEQGVTEASDYMHRGGYCFTISGEDRAPYFEDLIASRTSIEPYWKCKAEQLVMGSDGAAKGVICDNNGVITQINCKAVISCGGGFISNDDMKKKYYGGTNFVCQGFSTVNGSSMQMCIDAGAQMGKNFSVSVNEMGGCNYNASSQFAWIPGTGTNQCMYMLLLGGLMVNRAGERFVRESRLVTSMMFTGEPLVRENIYYIVLDETMVNKVRTTPLLDLFTDEAKTKLAPILQMGFAGFTCDQLDTDLEKATEEGWAYKADTIAELAEHYGLDALEDTVEQYNAIPAAGDDMYYLESEYVHTVESGPYYIFQYNPGSWCTLGGIRTDSRCRALNTENDPISGLYVAGLDADLFSVPYFSGGTAQGFSYASGMLAAQTAAADMA